MFCIGCFTAETCSPDVIDFFFQCVDIRMLCFRRLNTHIYLYALVRGFKEAVILEIGNCVLSFGLKTIGKEDENGIHKFQRQ